MVIDFENLDPLPPGALDLAPNVAISLKSRAAVNTLLPPDLHYQVGCCMHSAAQGLAHSSATTKTLLPSRLTESMIACQHRGICSPAAFCQTLLITQSCHQTAPAFLSHQPGPALLRGSKFHQPQAGKQADIH